VSVMQRHERICQQNAENACAKGAALTPLLPLQFTEIALMASYELYPTLFYSFLPAQWTKTKEVPRKSVNMFYSESLLAVRLLAPLWRLCARNL
jgi:hypothetical protein